MNRQRPNTRSSTPCPRCGKLISINSDQCIYCGLGKPGNYLRIPVVNDLIADRISFVQPITIDARLVAKAVVEVCNEHRDSGKPVLCCFMGREDELSGIRILREANLPVYEFPEAAARSLAPAASHRRCLEARDRLCAGAPSP